MSRVCDLVQERIVPLINTQGYDVVEISYTKKPDGMNLEIVIDCDAGVNINDCEKIHRLIDEPLDELNPTSDMPYTLSVSSPGIDRPLKTERDFQRNKDCDVEVSLYTKIDGKKKFEGKLISWGETITIETATNGEKTFQKEKVAQVLPIIKI